MSKSKSKELCTILNTPPYFYLSHQAIQKKTLVLVYLCQSVIFEKTGRSNQKVYECS